MKYLLDTNVLSEARRKRPAPAVVHWLGRVAESRLYLSVLVIGEIRKGIAKLTEVRKQQEFTSWLEGELVPRFGERVLDIDTEIAFTWGRLSGEAERKGEPVSVVDSLLAATAIRHNLTLVTHNVRDFASFPIEVLNPWTDQ